MVSLCYDPYHLKSIKYEHIAALTSPLKIQEAVALNFRCLIVLNCIAQTNTMSIVKDVDFRVLIR